MRDEKTVEEFIVKIAQEDTNIRAVILYESRATSSIEAALELLRNVYRLAPKRPTPLDLVVECVV